MSALYQPFPILPGRRAQAWRHQPAFRRPRHFHSEPELNLVVRGSGVLGVGDKTLSVSRGQLVLFEPGQDHALLDASNDFDLFVFALTPALAERALGPRKLGSFEGVELHPAELLETSAELGGLGAVSDAAAVEERLVKLFRLALERSARAHVHCSRAIDCLRAEHDLSESELAERLRTAPSTLSRRFRSAVGVPLVEYRARLRLMRFVELVDGGESFTRAALGADFGSYAQCYRVFSRVLGCAPQDYFETLRGDVDERTA